MSPVCCCILEVSRQVIIFIIVYLLSYAISLVGYALTVLACWDSTLTGIAQTEVCTLTVGQVVILIHRDFLLKVVIVSTVVGNMKLTIAIDE